MASAGLRQSLGILAAVAENGPGIGFNQLRRKLDNLPAATVSRLLKVLIDEGWVTKNTDGLYQCAEEYVRSSEQVCRYHSTGRRLAAIVTRLASDTGESAAYAEWSGDGFVFRAKHEMPDSYHYIDIGERNKDRSNGFFVFGLAFQGDDYARNLLRWLGTPDARLPMWISRRNEIREKGWWTSFDKGTRILVAVRRDQAYAGTIGISMMPYERTSDELEKLTNAVRDAAEAAGRLLNREKTHE